MKTITDDRLYTTNAQKYSYYNYFAVIFAACIIIVSLIWMLLSEYEKFVPTTITVTFVSILYPVTALVGASWSLQSIYWMRHGFAPLDRRYQLAWLFIGSGLLANCIAGILHVLLFLNRANATVHLYQQPVFANPLILTVSLLFYPLFLIGLLLLPGFSRLRMSVIFDILVAAVSLIGICWFLVANPQNVNNLFRSGLSSASPSPSYLITSPLYYPTVDLFLLLIFSLLILQGIESYLRISYLLLGASLLASLCADAIQATLMITDTHYAGGYAIINLFWFAHCLLPGLAALYQYTALLRKTQYEQAQVILPVQGAILPDATSLKYNRTALRPWQRVHYIAVPLALLLCLIVIVQMFYIPNALNNHNKNDGLIGLISIGAFAGVLIAIRRFFVARENEILLKAQERRYIESEHVRRLVEQLTDIRHLESLRERIVNAVLLEFGFTAAMLLLIEEYDSPLTSQAHLLVSTSSVSTHATKWRLHGDNILFRTVTLGKQSYIYWPHHLTDTPPEVLIWQEKQQIASMVFFPIIYQGKTLGSLGVARHALAHYSQSEVTVVRMYAEQIAAILEHAYIYQEAREREKFARAIANISTRLNAAVVEPAEISQLICNEGAHALRADCVIFYIKEEDGQLVPLAAVMNKQEHPVVLKAWPSFHIAEYEAACTHFLRPNLLQIEPVQKPPLAAETESTPTAYLLHDHCDQYPHVLRSRLAEYHIQTAILAPLVSGGHLIGLLVFARSILPGFNNELVFDSSDLPHAQDFVEQAGVTFTNAQLYQHLRTAHERLKELDQLKDQFMITASHELRTPLTTVQGYIELIAQYDEVLPIEQRRDFLQKARLGCEELAVLLRNVMDASRLEAEAGIKPALISRVSVRELIEKVQLMIEPQVTHEEREIEVNVPAHLVVYADPLRLHQVLMNVSSNALKYSLPGTPVCFTGRIFIDQGRHIVISVTDKGKGIAPGEQHHLFQRFYRLETDMNSPIRGSGLGLYISRRLIEAMGGKIWIESNGIAGEGSTFHIQLPMA